MGRINIGLCVRQKRTEMMRPACKLMAEGWLRRQRRKLPHTVNEIPFVAITIPLNRRNTSSKVTSSTYTLSTPSYHCHVHPPPHSHNQQKTHIVRVYIASKGSKREKKASLNSENKWTIMELHPRFESNENESGREGGGRRLSDKRSKKCAEIKGTIWKRILVCNFPHFSFETAISTTRELAWVLFSIKL